MPIVLPESFERPAADIPDAELTPREIVAELDKHIIGQKAAKKAVAIALRTVSAGASCLPPWPTRSHPRTSS